MYELKTSCNGISQMVGNFDGLQEAKLAASLAMYLFVQKFSQLEEFDTNEGELWCSAKGRKTGFDLRVEVIKVGA